MKRRFSDEEEEDDSPQAKISRKLEELASNERHCERFISNIEFLLTVMKKEKKDIQHKISNLEKLGFLEDD